MSNRRRSFVGRVRILILTAVMAVAAGFTGCGDDDGGNPTGGQDDNIAPVIDSMRISVPVTAPADSVQIWCYARDIDGDPLTYSWESEDGAIAGSGVTVKWVAANGSRSHSVTVTVNDGREGAARDTVSIEVMEGTLLLQTRDGVVAVDARGGSFVFSPITTSIEVLGTQIFVKAGTAIHELDRTGADVRTIYVGSPIVSGYDFVMLSSGGFVFASNESDSVHFMLADGTYVESVPMPNPSPDELQNIDGVVAGSRLYLSENGNNEILAFDLDTREASIFRSFPDWGGWLGAIDYDNGFYYLCGSKVIRRFTEAGEPEDIATLPNGNISGVATVGNYVYAVVNFEGTLHRVDTRTGADEILLTGLNYPQDVEHLPIKLEPVPGK